MKKILSVLLLIVVCTTFFACGHTDGDLGKRTTKNEENGYTLMQEVRPFDFDDEEEALEGMKGIRLEGFKVTKDNTTGPIKTKSDVVKIAREEATVEYNTISLYFDRTTGVWKAVLSFATETTAKDGTISRETVEKESIFVDEDGYTLFSVKH